MEEQIILTTFGALSGLLIAIIAILRKVPPVYGMMLGALAGALIGGANVTEAVELMMGGAKGIIPAVLRILAAGILSGVLIESGAAKVISETLIAKLGSKRSLLALAVATLVLTAVGVFIDVAVITVAPIALTIATRANLSRMSVLIAMIGGGKAGNIISANPNAIAASKAFDIDLTSLMLAGIVPAIFGVIVTYIIANYLKNKGTSVDSSEIENEEITVSGGAFFTAILGPVVAIGLLALRPLMNISIDPMLALPIGGLVGALAMGKIKHINDYAVVGLNKMSGVAIMLLGTGTLSAVIKNSTLKDVIINLLESTELPSFILAPISGMLMSLVTASTTAGTTTASEVFGPTILELGVAPLAAAAMIQAGATVLDHMPHGSFFHSTSGAVNMKTKEALRLLPYQTLIGFSLTVVFTIMYGFFG